VLGEHGSKRSMMRAVCTPWLAEPTPSRTSGSGRPEVAQEAAGERVVVVLAGVHHDLRRAERAAGPVHRSELRVVGARADDVQELHEGRWGGWGGAVGPDGWSCGARARVSTAGRRLHRDAGRGRYIAWVTTPDAPTLRLGYLVSQYPTATHTFVLREIRHLRRQGVAVHAVSVRPPERAAAELPEEEREEARLTRYVLGRGWGAVLGENLRHAVTHPGRYARGLALAARRAGPDARRLASYLAYWLEAVVAGRALTAAGVRHVHTHFSSTVAQFLPTVADLTWSATLHGPDEFADVVGFNLADKAREARLLVAISHHAASQIMRAAPPEHWAHIAIAPLGIDPGRYAPRTPPGARARAELVCVARLAPVKGQLVLLDAVAELVRGGRDVHLRLVGDGPSRAMLEARVAELGLGGQVTFAGWRTQDEVRGYLADADAFVLSSFAEGVPVVLMEAMAMEVPCVATHVNGVPELIRDGCDGLLVPPADARAVADAVRRLLDDPDGARALGASGRRRVQERYDLATNVDRLAALLRPLAAVDARR
jgi:glycosyltransferase involved in cell wall biosynthesis